MHRGKKSGKMMGSVGFRVKPAEVEDTSFDSWLIRYFSIKAPMRTVSKKRVEKADVKVDIKRTTVLGRFVQPIAANPSLLRGAEEETQPPAIIYGIVEQKNLPSMNFSAQMGLETVGEMTSFSFSRMRPSRSARLEQLNSGEYETMLSLIQDFYRDYTLFISDPLFRNDDYYVIKEAGRVVAGAQIYHVKWKIVDFGSGMSNRLVRLLTMIPWVRKRFNPDELRLLAFDGIYCERGYEPALYELMEAMLERTNTYVSMLMMDSSSDLYSIFRVNRKLGVLHKVLGAVTADIRMRFINMPEKTRRYFLEHPTYISTYDNS